MRRFLCLSGINFLLFFLLSTTAFGQLEQAEEVRRLSPHAHISLLTCGPGDALFEAFGHTALRVYDPVTDFDMVYNYGMFSFDQPNFYLNFTKGYLNYRLGRTDFDRFLYQYTYYNRSVDEQVLNLNQEQKQAVFSFLETNNLPENREYYYDYFFDNCSTRPRDALMQVLGNSLEFHYGYADTLDYSIRDLANHYLEKSDKYAWGSLGINVGLGAKIDPPAAPFDYMYQPEFLFLAFEEATLLQADGSVVPLVKSTHNLYQASPEPEEGMIFTPDVVFWMLLLLGATLSILEWRRKRYSLLAFDFVLFTAIGITGLLLSFIWFFTNHTAAANNWNVAWAWPTHFIAGIMLFSRRFSANLKTYFIAAAASSALLLLFWPWLPQDLHEAFIPLLLLIVLRSLAIARAKGKEGKAGKQAAAFEDMNSPHLPADKVKVPLKS